MIQQLKFHEANVGILAVMKDIIFFEKRQEFSYCTEDVIYDLKTLSPEIMQEIGSLEFLPTQINHVFSKAK